MNTEIQPLPPFLKSTPRYEEERQRLSDAEACLRAATRHAEMARNGHYQAAWDLLEKQVVLPFERLVEANNDHVNSGNEEFLSEWEDDALGDYSMVARALHKAKQLPKWTEEEIADITKLQRLFPEALTTEPLDLNDNPVVREEYHGEDRWDYVPVIEAALRDIANRGGAEG